MNQAVDPTIIRTAPAGQFRIVHEDVRDQWPTVERDCPDLASVQAALREDWSPHVRELVVYDDQGRLVPTN